MARRSSFGRPTQFAVAPVAMMTACARTVSPSLVSSTNGRCEKSHLTTSALVMRVPKRSACCWKSDIISGPETPCGKPG